MKSCGHRAADKFISPVFVPKAADDTQDQLRIAALCGSGKSI
jgi:hypothetical protein